MHCDDGQLWDQWTMSLIMFQSQLKFSGRFIFAHLNSYKVITTSFAHDTVTTCIKMCSQLKTRNGIIAKHFFHQIWITMRYSQWNGSQTLIAVWVQTSAAYQNRDTTVLLSLTLKRLGHFFQNVILFSHLVHHQCNIFIWNLCNTMNEWMSIVDADGLVL